MGYPDTDQSDESGSSGLSGPLAAFYSNLFYWREQLARSVARNNIGVRSSEIALAVYRILFSFVLLAIAQDRGFISRESANDVLNAKESGCRLMEIVADAGDLWAEPGGDSGSQSRHKQDFWKIPVIDEPVIKAIAARLDSQDRPYDFSRISPEEIAGVFDRFLASTIRRSAAHQAVVDPRDAGSGQQVPAPVLLNYTVDQTLSAARAGRSPDEPLPLRILDPACGAGSLLIRAYHGLVPPQDAKHTFAEKSDILRYTIHGLDIDPHMVAAARMLLACAACEGEDAKTLYGEFFAVYGGLVRILSGTIRCGNALVGPEISGDESWAFCPARERHNLRCFDWRQNFWEVLTPGGFDAVLCNPPENPVPEREWLQQYFQRHYSVYDRDVEVSAFFVEKGLSLLRPRGVLGFVTGDRWLHAKSGAPLRELLLGCQIEEIAICGDGDEGFCILRLTNAPPLHPFIVRQAGCPSGILEVTGFPADPQELSAGGWTFRDTRKERLLEKISRAGTPLEEYVLGEIRRGITVEPEAALVIDAAQHRLMVREDPRCRNLLCPYACGKKIGRYGGGTPANYCIFIPQGWTNHHPAAAGHEWRWFKKRHAGITRHLKGHVSLLKDRPLQGDYWWEVAGDPDAWQVKEDRIVFQAGVFPPQFTLLSGRWICDDDTIIIPSKSPYLLGLLNSRLAAFVFAGFAEGSGTGNYQDAKEIPGRFPVAIPDPDDPDDAARYGRMVALVTEMLELQRQQGHAQSDRERQSISCEIDSIDKQIDSLVYGIYGFSVEEIAVVESLISSTKSPSFGK